MGQQQFFGSKAWSRATGRGIRQAAVGIVLAASAVGSFLVAGAPVAAADRVAAAAAASHLNVQDFGTPPVPAAVSATVADCRERRLAANVADFGAPFAATMAAAVDDRGRHRRDTNTEDFGAPAPGG